jgi:hypothetical protein
LATPSDWSFLMSLLMLKPSKPPTNCSKKRPLTSLNVLVVGQHHTAVVAAEDLLRLQQQRHVRLVPRVALGLGELAVAGHPLAVADADVRAVDEDA